MQWGGLLSYANCATHMECAIQFWQVLDGKVYEGYAMNGMHIWQQLNLRSVCENCGILLDLNKPRCIDILLLQHYSQSGQEHIVLITGQPCYLQVTFLFNLFGWLKYSCPKSAVVAFSPVQGSGIASRTTIAHMFSWQYKLSPFPRLDQLLIHCHYWQKSWKKELSTKKHVLYLTIELFSLVRKCLCLVKLHIKNLGTHSCLYHALITIEFIVV